jgi:ribosome-associated protein
MIFSEERLRGINSEIIYSATRSSGPGGQNVNKVNTRVELRFSVNNSEFLSAFEKGKIRFHLKNRINTDGDLLLVSQVERSQWRNKQVVTKRFFDFINKALTPTKKRIKTKPTRSSKLRRLESKTKNSLKKQLRKRPNSL